MGLLATIRDVSLQFQLPLPCQALGHDACVAFGVAMGYPKQGANRKRMGQSRSGQIGR